MSRLSFSDVLSESFRFFFGNLPLFFHVVTVPWVMSVAIRVVGSLLVPDDDLIYPALIEKTLDILPTAMFQIAWMRVVLLGPNSLEHLPGLRWSRRETAYLLHLIQVGGITFALVVALTLTLGTLDPDALRAGTDPEVARRQAMAAPLAAGFIVSMVLALRVCWGLAGTAVDVPFSPRLSWAYSRGNGWTIVGAIFLIAFAGAAVTFIVMLLVVAVVRGITGPGLGAASVAWTVAILVSYAGTAVIATAMAVIFRSLLGWQEGKPLPAPT